MNVLKWLTLSVVAVAISSCSTSTKPAKEEQKFKYAYEHVEGDPLNTYVYTLENGLKVYMSINKAEPRIQTNIAVNTGSKQDPSDATGLAHYLEHMLFKGSSKIASLDWEKEKVLLQQVSDLYEQHKAETDQDKRKAIYYQIDSISGEAAKFVVANEYDKMISSLGAKGTNAYTSVERTVYINDIPSNEIEKWLTIESERFSELVLRLFHTELEAVYEEYNRSRDNDYWLSYEEMAKQMFQKHPYGTQTTIGTSEHLKSPSMEKIHAYFNERYVANNMAIILAGDIDPDKTIALIEKYFGSLRTGKVPAFTFEPEDDMTEPLVSDVFGPNTEWVDLGFRLPGVNHKDMLVGEIFSELLYNRQAGLIDLNLVKAQKVLGASAYIDMNLDYSSLSLSGEPRENQSLEEVKNLLLGQIELVKNGQFEDWMLPAIIKNKKLELLQYGEYNRMRTSVLTNAFIFNQDMATVVGHMDALDKITKEQVVLFANTYFNNNYVVVNKRTGKSPAEKVEKPSITEVQLNRDTASAFALAFENMPSTRLDPVFNDYKATISNGMIKENVPLYYVHNKETGLFQLEYIVDMGSLSDKELALAVNYLEFLGTEEMSASELQIELFKLGLSYSVYAAAERVYVSLSGLDESFEQGVKLFEGILANAKADQKKYDNFVADNLKKRKDAKLDKYSILNRGMLNYGMYGADSPAKNIISEEDLKTIDINMLAKKIKGLMNYEHLVYYYGSIDQSEVEQVLNTYHNSPSQLEKLLPKRNYEEIEMSEDKVYFVHYDMVQAEMMMISKGGLYNQSNLATANVFNEYFGGGLSSIVFQEIRESKALAYSAYAYYTTPNDLERAHYVRAYVGTQVDKLADAKKAMIELMNDMPEANDQFNDAKLAAQKKIETSRTKPQNVFWQFLSAKKMGRDYDVKEEMYQNMKGIEMEQLRQFFNANVKGKKYTYLVVGDRDLVDMDALKEMGTLEELSLEELFGY
ncbi:MAG: zinc protease [Salibacteraceae bacterium]|jgi:zinc protease